MKDRSLVLVSLSLSLVSLGYAGWVHHHSHGAAVQALREREQELVTNWRPKLGELYSALSEEDLFPVPPATLEELFRPLEKILSKLSYVPPPFSESTIPEEVPE